MKRDDATNSEKPGYHSEPDTETHLENASETKGAYMARRPAIECPATTLSSEAPRIPSAYGMTSRSMNRR